MNKYGDTALAMNIPGLPPAQGLYSPHNEHDACGIGFVVPRGVTLVPVTVQVFFLRYPISFSNA
jgi:hypothetical protein